MDNEELTLEENVFLYSLLDNASKTLGIQNKEQFAMCVQVGEKLASRIQVQTKEQQENGE